MALSAWFPLLSAAAVVAVTAVVLSVDGTAKTSTAKSSSPKTSEPSAPKLAGPSAPYKALEKALVDAKGNASVYNAAPNKGTFAPIQQNYNEAERQIKRIDLAEEKMKGGELMKQIKAIRDTASAAENARKKGKPAGPTPGGQNPVKPAIK